MKSSTAMVTLATALTVLAAAGYAAQTSAGEAKSVLQVYPRLALGVLTYAKATELPDDVVLRAGSVVLNGANISSAIAAQPAALREDLKRNAHLILNDLAARSVLLQVAKETLAREGQNLAGKPANEVIQRYLDSKVLSQVTVTNAEVSALYEADKSTFGGAKLADVYPSLKQYLLSQKKQEAVAQHTRDLGKSTPIEVSASWLGRQAVMARDNVVDRARDSGQPSLVDFGSTGCVACDMMAPILDTLKVKYQGRVNVLFVHVREKQVLAARYGIQTIPVQVFFDKEGDEVFRHIGYWPQPEVEKKLAEMGVK